jgi:hypothetical protein
MNLNRVLYCIAGTTLERIDVIEQLLDNARDWCEGGLAVTVIIDIFEETHINYIELSSILLSQHSCSRAKWSLNFELHGNDMLNISASMFHRLHFQKYLNDFDIFVFGEDDMSIRFSTLQQWRVETAKLEALSLDLDYQIGFVRYENARTMLRSPKSVKNVARLAPNLTAKLHSNSLLTVPLNRITWEWDFQDLHLNNANSDPYLATRGSPDNYYLVFNHNNYLKHCPFSAIGIFSRPQLQALERSCFYLSRQTAEAELGQRMTAFYSSTQPYHCGPMEITTSTKSFNFTSPEAICCKKWLLPVESFQYFFVHHVGTPGIKMDNKWLNRHNIVRAAFLGDWKKKIQQMLIV